MVTALHGTATASPARLAPCGLYGAGESPDLRRLDTQGAWTGQVDQATSALSEGTARASASVSGQMVMCFETE